MSGRSLGLQAVAYAGATGAAQLITALLYVLAARGSSVEEFGAVVAAIGAATSASGFIDFGTNGLWVRELSSGRADAQEVSRRAVGKSVVALLVGAAWIAIGVGAGWSCAVTATGALLAAVVLNQMSAVPLRGLLRTHQVAIGVVADRLSAIATFSVLVLSGVASVDALVAGLILGPALGTIVNRLLTPPRHRLRLTAIPLIPWAASGYFGISAVAVSAQSLDVALLGLLGGASAAGLYGSVNRWTQPMTLLGNAFSTAAAPFIARTGELRTAWVSLRGALWLPAVALLACIGVIAAAPLLVPLLLGGRYDAAVPVLQIIGFAAFLSVCSQPAFVALQYLSRERYAAAAVWGGVVLQVGCLLALAPYWGALGAAVASVVAQVAVLALSVAMIRQVWRRDASQEE